MRDNQEPMKIKRLLENLEQQEKRCFPKQGALQETTRPGVYVIRSKSGRVYHVGRTYGGVGGLQGRLRNHLHGQSSFTKKVFKRDGSRLRGRYTYQCLEVPNDRHRALLEHLAVGKLCPKHLGLGTRKEAQAKK